MADVNPPPPPQELLPPPPPEAPPELPDDSIAPLPENGVAAQPSVIHRKEGLEDKDVVFTGKVVQVTNVSPGATLQQMATLFGFLGTVTDIRLYPQDETIPVSVRVCYIKYENSEQCGVAQHLTNTVFIDKPLIVVPIDIEEPPEESECQNLILTLNAYAAMHTSGFLPQAFPVEDPLSSIPGLPPPPVITSSTDPSEIEDIRKTIFVENIADAISTEQLMAFFSGVGEVKYLRMCKAEVGKYAYIEFMSVESVPLALQYNGVIFGSRHLKVVHSKNFIIKPESVRIASGRTPVRKYVETVKRPSMDRFSSRSPVRKRSRTRSPIRRRSPSRSPIRSRRRRSRTRSPPRRRRSRTRSPVRRRSRSRTRSPPIRRRSRSRSPARRRRSRSKSRDKKRSRSRSPRRKSKRRSRSRSPSRRRSRRSTSKSPDRSSSSRKKKKDKEREKDKGEKSKDKKEEDTTKELDSLLSKIHDYEEEQKKSGDDKKKKKD